MGVSKYLINEEERPAEGIAGVKEQRAGVIIGGCCSCSGIAAACVGGLYKDPPGRYLCGGEKESRGERLLWKDRRNRR